VPRRTDAILTDCGRADRDRVRERAGIMSKRKRTLAAVVAAVTVFTMVYAVAASLGVTSGGLGAGSDTVASCDTAVSTSYDTAYSAALPGYKVTTVHVTGIATTACDGKSIRVTLVGALDVSLAEKTGTLATPAVDPAFDFSSSNVAASDVVKVAVVISG
jgi:hypothetical protein